MRFLHLLVSGYQNRKIGKVDRKIKILLSVFIKRVLVGQMKFYACNSIQDKVQRVQNVTDKK